MSSAGSVRFGPEAVQLAAMLELIYDDAEGTHRVPIREVLTFGRSNDNDVVLRDFSVSRHHARIDIESGVPRITDLDSTELAGATVTLGGADAGDVLAFGNAPSGVSGVFDSGTGTLTFTGSATLAEYQTLLQSVTLAAGESGIRTVSFAVTDAEGNASVPGLTVVTVLPAVRPGCGTGDALRAVKPDVLEPTGTTLGWSIKRGLGGER